MKEDVPLSHLVISLGRNLIRAVTLEVTALILDTWKEVQAGSEPIRVPLQIP